MNEETKIALAQSIEKWERNAKVESLGDASTGWIDCPLCLLFFRNRDCGGCPVSKSGAHSSCQGTPYEQALAARMDGDLSAFHDAAELEVTFLRSLQCES